MRSVHWTKQLTEDFIDLAMLNEDESYILRSRVKNTPISIQADYLCCSPRTVDRMIKELKHKYDLVQKEYPDKFPVRRTSATEKWLDTH